MKNFVSAFALLLGALSLPVEAAAPVISHQPAKMAPRAQPLSVIARVSSPDSPVSSATLHFSQSADASPVDLPMKQTAPGTFLGTIPANYLAGKGTIRYYIEAANEAGDWSETPWHTVSVQDPGESTPKPSKGSSESETASWVWPTVIIGGGALAVAGAIALADSGGGGGGSDNGGTDNGGNGGDGDISDRLVVRSASGQSNSDMISLPDDTSVNGVASLGGRKISNIRVDLDYDPVDGAAEEFQVIYRGSPVLSTGKVEEAGSRTITLSGDDAEITFRVLTSLPGPTDTYQWNWNGTVTYILETSAAKTSSSTNSTTKAISR
jgi:hypothetical protein